MADGTHIEWTDATWNVVTGCSVVSPGCTNCYAMKLAGTRLRDHPSRQGLTIDSKAGPVWNGQVRFNAGWLTQPLRWTKPRRIFVAAHGDLFHEGVTDRQLDQIFAVMALCPQHTFQVLTKRPEMMRSYLTDHGGDGTYVEYRIGEHFRRLGAEFNRDHFGFQLPLPNVWLGVSVEDQVRANERIPELLQTPAAVRWISAEPLLGPVDLTSIEFRDDAGRNEWWDALSCPVAEPDECNATIDWVVAGGESGPGARPMHPAWARRLRDQCAAAGVPFLFKQWGGWLPWLQFNEAGVVDRPEQSRFEAVIWQDDRWEDLGRPLWCDLDDNYGGGANGPDDPDQVLGLVGKKAAGRILDGQIHDGYPEARS